MLTPTQLESVARMMELDPPATYPVRGAEQIARALGSRAFRLVIDERTFFEGGEWDPRSTARFEISNRWGDGRAVGAVRIAVA